MSFSYDTNLSANRDILRREIGDLTENDGPRPGAANFSNEELDYYLTANGDHIGRSATRLLYLLAIEWAAYAGRAQIGTITEQFDQAHQYRMIANDYAAQYYA